MRVAQVTVEAEPEGKGTLAELHLSAPLERSILAGVEVVAQTLELHSLEVRGLSFYDIPLP